MEDITPETKLGVAVFGLGRAGQYHLPNLAAHPEVCVRWLVDVDAAHDKAQQLCSKYGLRHASFVPTNSCQQVFDDTSTKAVVIATPTLFHEALIKRAVATGKHVFCEKPISFTADLVRSCYAEAKKHGCVLFCGFNRRFEKHHLALKDKIDLGELGSVRVIHYNARDPKTSSDYVQTYIKNSGGIFCDSAIHQLDYMMWLLGGKPCSVLAVGGQTSEEAEDFKACDDVDSVFITLMFPSGVRAHVEVIREAQEDFGYFRMEAVGTLGSHFSHKVTNSTLSTLSLDGTGVDNRCSMDFSDSHRKEMDCFINVVQGREKCPVKEEDVVAASELADLCKTSLKEERILKL